MTSFTSPLRIVESELIWYKRTWRGTVISSIVNPVLFLAAMGASLGALVDRGDAELGIPYLAFVATGLMAASGMQNGASDGSFPVMAGFLWRKHFQGMLTTPIQTRDIVLGRLMWTTIRLTFIISLFALIGVAFGAMELGPALLAVPPSVLCGLAFNTCVSAWTTTRRDGTSFSSLFRFGIVPLFLFSGTFFPISQLPDFLEPVAVATPLFHGVELARKIAIPGAEAPLVTTLPIWLHVTYLVVMAAVGLYLFNRLLDKRIRP